MTTMEIAQKVADCYGLSVDDLEAGSFTPEEMEVLISLSQKALNSAREDKDIRAYFEQKAKFITKDRKERLAPGPL